MFGRHGFKMGGRGFGPGCVSAFGGGRGFGGFGHGGGGFREAFGRMRRGDIKFHILETVKDTPRHGYEIISELEKQSGGYRPSPGSVYPTLQMLEEGGFLTSQQIESKKVYTITESGLQLLAERGETNFEVPPGMANAVEVRKSMMKLGASAMDAVRGGDEETIKKVTDIINQARKDIYAILAE